MGIELYHNSFQHVELKMSKRKVLLNHDSAIALLGVSFIICFYVFLFHYELSNYVTSSIVGAIIAPFKYVGNKISIIYTIYTTLISLILLFVTYIEYLRFINLLLSGDVETIPEPFNRCKYIIFYHWNLNGSQALNHEKFILVETFIIPNNIDVFCMSETFLDSSIENIYDGWNIYGCTLVRSDHPSNTKLGCVAICYKDHLPVISRIWLKFWHAHVKY